MVRMRMRLMRMITIVMLELLTRSSQDKVGGGLVARGILYMPPPIRPYLPSSRVARFTDVRFATPPNSMETYPKLFHCQIGLKS